MPRLRVPEPLQRDVGYRRDRTARKDRTALVPQRDRKWCLCRFAKARVSPAFVDIFSRALKQFKQTEADQPIYQNISGEFR
jgi:hypothetical protein